MKKKKKKKWVHKTLKQRLAFDDKYLTENVISIVSAWLSACARQAAKNGSETASEVLEKTAQHLDEGLI